MGIRYTDDPAEVSMDRLEGFWEGWPRPPSRARHLAALRRSEVAVVAIDDDDGHVVGFATAIGDGALAAFIPFLEVLPAYRGRGIGSELVGRVLARLGDRYSVDLVCDPGLAPFYERLGFVRLTAMSIRRPEALAEDAPLPDRTGRNRSPSE